MIHIFFYDSTELKCETRASLLTAGIHFYPDMCPNLKPKLVAHYQSWAKHNIFMMCLLVTYLFRARNDFKWHCVILGHLVYDVFSNLFRF